LNEGTAHMVLPLYNNQKYIAIEKGNHFGIIDIIGCQILKENQNLDDWYQNRYQLIRHFSIQVSSVIADTLTLSLS
jgi:hypothetical protein